MSCRDEGMGEPRPTSCEPRIVVSSIESVDLLEAWDRIGLAVRCAYNPFCACPIRRFLVVGQCVIDAGARPELAVHQRLLQVLLQAARDDGLLVTWRRACLEYAALPLQRLHGLLCLHDPIACDALRSAVQAAGNELANAIANKDPT